MRFVYEVTDSRQGGKRQLELAIFTSYPTRREWNNCFIKFKPLNIWVKTIFLTFFIQRNLSEYTLEWFGGLFDPRSDFTVTHVEIFAPFKQVWSLGFVVYAARFDVVFGFSVWFFELELKPLLDLLNIGFTITENGLFCGGTQEVKNFRIDSRLSLTKWQCITDSESRGLTVLSTC